MRKKSLSAILPLTSSIVLVPLTVASIRVAVLAFPVILMSQVPDAPPPVSVGEYEL